MPAFIARRYGHFGPCPEEFENCFYHPIYMECSNREEADDWIACDSPAPNFLWLTIPENMNAIQFFDSITTRMDELDIRFSRFRAYFYHDNVDYVIRFVLAFYEEQDAVLAKILFTES